MPQDWDNKTCEFEYAKSGMIGLQTCYNVLKTTMPEVSEEKWIELLSINPRTIFGLELPVIKENERANLTLFQPENKYTFAKEHIKSRSHNSPLIGTGFTGKVAGIINGEKLVLNSW
jgi:dihydroorotase